MSIVEFGALVFNEDGKKSAWQKSWAVATCEPTSGNSEERCNEVTLPSIATSCFTEENYLCSQSNWHQSYLMHFEMTEATVDRNTFHNREIVNVAQITSLKGTADVSLSGLDPRV